MFKKTFKEIIPVKHSKGCYHRKGMTEDEMVGWHHRLSGHEFE